MWQRPHPSNSSRGLGSFYSTAGPRLSLSIPTLPSSIIIKYIFRKQGNMVCRIRKIQKMCNTDWDPTAGPRLSLSVSHTFADQCTTRTQVLELGPRDLEPLHHDPHCILVASSLMKMQRMRMQWMRMQRMRMQRMRITPGCPLPRMHITPRCASPLGAHHHRMCITPRCASHPDAHHLRCIIIFDILES